MAGCGCDNNNPGVDYTSLPLLEGCPGDAETILVGNAMGGVGGGKYARRTWADIKACLTGTIVPPLIGVVGGGGADDPTAGAVDFQNDKLKGLGSSNAGRIQIVVDDILYTNFGTNINFSFDNTTGIISDFFWVTGAGLYIDLNQ